MCRPRSRRGCGSWTRVARTRTTRTMLARPRSSRCGTESLRVVGVEDHRQVLRLLARRHHQLVAGRTRAICRVHALLAETIEGGATRNLSVNTAVSALRRFRPTDTIGRRTQTSRHRAARRGPSSRPGTRRAPPPHRHRGHGREHDRHRRVRCRSDRRVLPHRLQRRRSSVPDRWALRPLQRDRTDRSIIGTEGSPSTEPERQPAAEPCDPHRRARSDQSRHTRPRLLPPQTDRREVAQRSDALLETTDQRRHLPPAPRRHRPLKQSGAREDNQGRL